jgi:hypothetical protein
LQVLTHDQRLETFALPTKASGFSSATRRVSPGDYVKRAAAMTPKPNPAALAAAQKQCGPRQLVKLVAQQGERTAVAYWGGTLEIRDTAGAVKFRNVLPQDITALIWADDLVVAGLADGRVVGLEAGK